MKRPDITPALKLPTAQFPFFDRDIETLAKLQKFLETCPVLAGFREKLNRYLALEEKYRASDNGREFVACRNDTQRLLDSHTASLTAAGYEF